MELEPAVIGTILKPGPKSNPVKSKLEYLHQATSNPTFMYTFEQLSRKLHELEVIKSP